METWIMVGAKRARNAERPTQPSLDLTSRAPWFYPDPESREIYEYNIRPAKKNNDILALPIIVTNSFPSGNA